VQQPLFVIGHDFSTFPVCSIDTHQQIYKKMY